MRGRWPGVQIDYINACQPGVEPDGAAGKTGPRLARRAGAEDRRQAEKVEAELGGRKSSVWWVSSDGDTTSQDGERRPRTLAVTGAVPSYASTLGSSLYRCSNYAVAFDQGACNEPTPAQSGCTVT